MRKHVDVIVIGGGVIGLATAYELSRDGAKVLLIEKDYLGAEQSSRNWGFTRQQFRHSSELPLAVASLERWPRLDDELGAPTGWVRSGNLMVGEDSRSSEQFASWSVLGKNAGVPVEFLDRQQISYLAPHLDGRWVAGLFTANDGHAEPTQVIRAYASAARNAGCEIWTGCTVKNLRSTLGAVVGVETDQGVVMAPNVVVAAGTWSRRLATTVDVNLPIQWVRSSVARTVPVPKLESPVPVWAPGCAFRQGVDGRITFAPGRASDVDFMFSSVHNLGRFLPLWARNLKAGFRPQLGRPLVEDAKRGRARTGRFDRSEPAVNRSNLRAAHRRLEEIVPGLQGTKIESQWAGYIDGTPDSIPVLSRVEELSGLVVAAGFSGHGFGIAPAVGEAVAALTLGAEPAVDLAPFRLDRFAKVRLVGMPRLG